MNKLFTVFCKYSVNCNHNINYLYRLNNQPFFIPILRNKDMRIMSPRTGLRISCKFPMRLLSNYFSDKCLHTCPKFPSSLLR